MAETQEQARQDTKARLNWVANIMQGLQIASSELFTNFMGCRLIYFDAAYTNFGRDYLMDARFLKNQAYGR